MSGSPQPTESAPPAAPPFEEELPSLARVIRALREHQRFLITTHAHPDGDGLGSGLALFHMLRSLGKEPTYYASHPVPFNFAFLPGADEVVTDIAAHERFDATIIVDCAQLERCGSALPDADRRGELIVLDHHLASAGDAEGLIYRDEAASAVGEVVYFLAATMGVPIGREMAECIYTSIVSDTGSFRYGNTTPAAMRIAGEMIGLGVSPWEVASAMYESVPVERVKLLGEVLSTLHLGAGGRAATLLIGRDMLSRTGATAELIDRFINYARSIEGVEVAIQLREREPAADGTSRFKVSFRSRGAMNVSEIAVAYGGGGQHNAAGCELEGELDDVRDRLYAEVDRLLGEAP